MMTVRRHRSIKLNKRSSSVLRKRRTRQTDRQTDTDRDRDRDRDRFTYLEE